VEGIVSVSREHVVDVDRATGTLTLFHYQPSDENGFVIETKQDVEPIVELNKAQFNLRDERSRYGDTAQVARIPNVIWWDLKRRGIADDEAKLKAWLNDPDNRAFRTRPGRV
jgi:hypothetical protein